MSDPALELDLKRHLMNMAVAGILGSFVALLLVSALEFVDNALKTQTDVQKYLTLAALGAIPLVVPGKHDRT